MQQVVWQLAQHSAMSRISEFINWTTSTSCCGSTNMQFCELTDHISTKLINKVRALPQNRKLGEQRYQATEATETHIGPSFCGGLDDSEQLGGGDRAGGRGGHLGVPGRRRGLLGRHRHDVPRLAGPGAERTEAEGPWRRRVLDAILGEEGRGGGSGGEKIPCHRRSEKGLDASIPGFCLVCACALQLHCSASAFSVLPLNFHPTFIRYNKTILFIFHRLFFCKDSWFAHHQCPTAYWHVCSHRSRSNTSFRISTL